MGEPPGRQRFPPPCPTAKRPLRSDELAPGCVARAGGCLQRSEGRNQGSFPSTGQLATTFWLVGPRHKGSAGMCGPRVARVSEALEFSSFNESTSKLWPKVFCEHSITTNLESFCSSANNEMEGAAASLVYFVVNALLQPANKRADGDAGPMTSADDSAGAARSQRAAPACFFSDPFPTCQPFDSSQQRPGVGGRRQQPDSTIPRPGQGRRSPTSGRCPLVPPAAAGGC